MDYLKSNKNLNPSRSRVYIYWNELEQPLKHEFWTENIQFFIREIPCTIYKYKEDEKRGC